MSETDSSSAQIVAEWIITNPVDDSARWRAGMRHYEAGSLDDGAAMAEAAELMCAALIYYVADGTVIGDIGGESPETAVEQTIWNVLVAIAARRRAAAKRGLGKVPASGACRGAARRVSGRGAGRERLDGRGIRRRQPCPDDRGTFQLASTRGRSTDPVDVMVHRPGVHADADDARGAQ